MYSFVFPTHRFKLDILGKASLVVEKHNLSWKSTIGFRRKKIGCGKAQLVGGKAPGCVKSTIGCGKSTIGWGKAQFVNPGQIVIFGSVPAQVPMPCLARASDNLRIFKNILQGLLPGQSPIFCIVVRQYIQV